MSKIKKLMASLLAVAMIGSMGTSVFAEELESTPSMDERNLSSNEKIVFDFVDSINTRYWGNWVSFYSPTVKDYYNNFVNSSSNLADNVGILNVVSTDVVSMEKVSNRYAPKFYELAEYFESEDDYETYLVGIDMDVNENNEYFYDGVNYKLVVLVNDNGNWNVGGQSGAPIEALLESNGVSVDEAIDAYALRVFGSTAIPFGVGYGLLEAGSTPSTIKVANASGTTVYNVNFGDFVKNATQNEIGNMGFNANAIKAQAMAVKMTGWWCKVAQYRDSVGADIQYGDVAYVDGTTVNQSVKDAYSGISSYKMVSNSSTSGKLFYAAYFAGKKDSTGKGTGQLRQNGAEYLATNASYKYDWKQILHYYYDNSSYNNPDVGIVQIS